MLGKFLLILNTVRHLNYSQIFYQIGNRLKRNQSLVPSRIFEGALTNIQFIVKAKSYQKYVGRDHFSFLNVDNCFENHIDWNFSEYGKLWTYNLEYFDYLHQEDLELNEKIRLLEDFYKFSVQRKRTLEPYPVSLRAINIIRFTIANNLGNQSYHNYLYQELDYLHKNYEFHILGNHLLENAFALSMGGAYFDNQKWHSKAISILRRELEEQILADGAHFELSPMYHNIIFFRLLELIDWYSNYEHKDNSFLIFCQEKASLMLAWLENIRFENGDIPLFNDAANGIAYPSEYLIDYAHGLGIQRRLIPLGESGYRSFMSSVYEIKIDVAQIGASYQPGHAHADALSFILYHKGQPMFVEQGTSTYQIGTRRDLERSTEAHNTVVVDGRNQSQVWGGFRVAKRAKTTIHIDRADIIEASHDGYKSLGIRHKRQFLFKEDILSVKDELSNDGSGLFYLHLHPDRNITSIQGNTVLIDDSIAVDFKGAINIASEKYEYADTYNQYKKASRLVVTFTGNLETKINF